MRRGRPKQALRLSEEEQQRLRSLAQRARSVPAVARRARVVLGARQQAGVRPPFVLLPFLAIVGGISEALVQIQEKV